MPSRAGTLSPAAMKAARREAADRAYRTARISLEQEFDGRRYKIDRALAEQRAAARKNKRGRQSLAIAEQDHDSQLRTLEQEYRRRRGVLQEGYRTLLARIAAGNGVPPRRVQTR